MSDPVDDLDGTIARERLDQIVLGGLLKPDEQIIWGTIEDLDAAAWDDLSRALVDHDGQASATHQSEG